MVSDEDDRWSRRLEAPRAVEIALAVLVRGGRVLLGHRHPARRWYPDCWDPLHLDLTDVGLDVHAFLVTRWQGSPTNAAPDEHDDLGWFTAADLPGLRLAHRHYQDWLRTLLAERAPPGPTRRPAGARGVVDE